MAKRTLSRKQLAALARGRAKRKAKLAGRKPKSRTARERRALGYRKERKTTMAKKRRAAPRRRRAAPRRRRSGGGRRGGMLSGIEWKDMLGAAGYGWLEKQVAQPEAGKTAEDAWLKKVPLFFEGIGYAGCSAVLAHIAGKNVGGTIGMALRHYAKGTFDVAAYKLAKNGKLYESKAEAEAALAGDDDLSGYDDEVGYDLEGDEDSDMGADDELGDDEMGFGADGIT